MMIIDDTLTEHSDREEEAPFYDDSLSDDAAHEHVVSARAAGRAWAEREWETARETFDGDARDGTYRGPADWVAAASDARPLVEFGFESDVEDQHERVEELANICESAAMDRWDENVEAFEDSDGHAELIAISAAARDGFEHPRAAGLSSSPVAWADYDVADRAELVETRNSIADDLGDAETCREWGADGIRRAEDERDAIDAAIAALDAGKRVRAAQDEDGWWFALEVAA